jgi:hypothetical protein
MPFGAVPLGRMAFLDSQCASARPPQNCEVPTYSRTVTGSWPWASCSSLYSAAPPSAWPTKHPHLKELGLPVLTGGLNKGARSHILQDRHRLPAVSELVLAAGGCPGKNHPAEKDEKKYHIRCQKPMMTHSRIGLPP